MTLPVVYRRAATAEFTDAATHYENQRPNLGVEFIEEVNRCIDQVAANPLLFPVVHSEIRRAVVRRFPYCVYFRVEAKRIVVLAVFHGHRNPSTWESRG